MHFFHLWVAWLGQVFRCLSFVSYIQLWVHVLSSYILICLQMAWPVFAHIERVYTLCMLLVWIWLWPSPWSTSVRVCVGLQSALSQRGIYGKQQQQALSQNIWAGQRVTQAWQFFCGKCSFLQEKLERVRPLWWEIALHSLFKRNTLFMNPMLGDLNGYCSGRWTLTFHMPPS